MNLLPIDDCSTYIDLDKAQEFILQGAKYYKSEGGVWVRKEAGNSTGQAMPEREAFKAFMSAHKFEEAEECFPGLFEDGSKIAIVIDQDKRSSGARRRSLLRFALGGIAALLLAAYIAAVIAGKISASHQISAINLIVIVVVLIVIGILVRPEFLNNIQEFGIGGLSVKMRQQLREIQDTQKDQGKNLEELHFILETLVTTSEVKHLRKLAAHRTSNYKRSPTLVAEMRRLRDAGLIISRPEHKIGAVPATFDLAEWVELTSRGREYLKRLEEFEPPSGASTPPDPTTH
jgi:hypothetical protein